jgi:YegS/Rv2252/BmrU family lipid kinase
MRVPSIRTKVIVNRDCKPRKLKRYLKPALRILRHNGFQLSVLFTHRMGEVLSETRRAVEQGFEAVIVAGGDGTTNEAINGIVPHDIPLGILPFGGSNVFGREISLPMHPVRAAAVIARRRTRKIDLGLTQGRYFSMMASCGFDAYAISRTDPKVKKIINRYAYVWAGIKDFFGYRPTEIQLVLDDGKVHETGTFVAVTNCHFYGGWHEMTPFAQVDDGFLDILIYQGKSQFGLARFMFHMVYKQHLRMKKVRYYRSRKVELKSDKHTHIQVDGDPLGELPATVEIAPGAMRVFC